MHMLHITSTRPDGWMFWVCWELWSSAPNTGIDILRTPRSLTFSSVSARFVFLCLPFCWMHTEAIRGAVFHRASRRYCQNKREAMQGDNRLVCPFTPRKVPSIQEGLFLIKPACDEKTEDPTEKNKQGKQDSSQQKRSPCKQHQTRRWQRIATAPPRERSSFNYLCQWRERKKKKKTKTKTHTHTNKRTLFVHTGPCRTVASRLIDNRIEANNKMDLLILMWRSMPPSSAG